MPTIEIEYKDFQDLLGLKLPMDKNQLDDMLAYVKGEVKLLNEQEIHVEMKDSNRADLWSVEGLVRTLRGFLSMEKGLKNYKVAERSGVEVQVDPRLKKIRPYIGCAVVKDIEFTDVMIREIMHLQDKLDQTYGRDRRRTSIGLYTLDLLSPPLRYSVVKPDQISFVPLNFSEKMTLREILEKHPKGLEYGRIIRGHQMWPVLMDAKDNVLSFPPIINSDDLGRISEDTKNVLIEVTGTSHKAVLNTLTMVVTSLVDRGGKIYSTSVHYRYRGQESVVTPQLKTKTMQIDLEVIRKILGIELSSEEVAELLERARYGIDKIGRNSITVRIPCYRIDVMHSVDVAEDVAIAYGYNNIEPRWQRLPTTGAAHPETRFIDLVREIMIGLGFQEILTFVMTSHEILSKKIKCKPRRVLEVSNPKISSLTCLRDRLLPCLLEFLGHNTHVEYPQKVFEVGYSVVLDEKKDTKTRDVAKLACITTHSAANFAEIKSYLAALFLNLNLKRWRVQETLDPSFLAGRTASIHLNGLKLGIVGEIHPEVLNNFQLKNPAGGFEISLEKIREERLVV